MAYKTLVKVSSLDATTSFNIRLNSSSSLQPHSDLRHDDIQARNFYFRPSTPGKYIHPIRLQFISTMLPTRALAKQCQVARDRETSYRIAAQLGHHSNMPGID
ncbi:hypothetical protein IAQ61_010772 [Plenodomus lingam]|uniref:uncharacterized protein n=1 Tax=Leptosphaeria maculans TaxID=5022 RepID=UPI00331E78D3|nr:hypothetical protein IAQ61_010772 [Plenodomus lingam]